MERMRVEDGVEDDEEDEEEGLPFLLKDWRDSCLVMASITVAGTFTGHKKNRNDLVLSRKKRVQQLPTTEENDVS